MGYDYLEMYKLYLEKACHLTRGRDGHFFRGLYRYSPHILRTQAFCLREVPGGSRHKVKDIVIDLDRLKRWYKVNTMSQVAG